MNNGSAKWLLFGLVMVLFSLVAVFAAFVFLLIAVAGTEINTFPPAGQGIGIFVCVAIVIGIVGLAIAYVGVTWND